MLPSFISQLFWGSSEESPKELIGQVTTEEGNEGWLLVNRARESGSTSSTGQQDWDMDSVGSDGSWVLTPSATFTAECPSLATSHPMEDLLIEHPAMSVYQQPTDEGQANSELERAQLKREVVLKNRRRGEVAYHLQIPLGPERRVRPRRTTEDKQLTRRALKKQNANSTLRGHKQVNKVSKVPMKATGKRRC